MFFGVLTIFMSSFIKKCDVHATEYIMKNASTYYNEANELFPSDKERYDKKLQCLYGLGTYCDPFGIPDQHWVDDVSKWPPVDYPSIYTYFIETPGGYTREREGV